MKTFWTKKNIAIVLAVLLVAAVVVLCIALRQKSVEDTEPTLTLTCQSADAVIRRGRALSGFIGRKGRVGGPEGRG